MPSRHSGLAVKPSRNRSTWSAGTRTEVEWRLSPRSLTGIACSSAVTSLTVSVSPLALAISIASARCACRARPADAAASAR